VSRRRRSFGWGDWYESPPKQPVPADGIAAGKFGSTWWGREWMASLERLGRSWANRLPRGRSYARQGRVVDLAVGAGVVTAGVVGTRPRPYRVEIGLTTLDPATWRRAVDALAEDTLLVVRLLGRELPDEVAHRLAGAGVALFPSRNELRTTCSCPDVANPCKHVAAVHYLFAAALDNDPFLLFRLRGLDRDDLLDALAGEGAEDGSSTAMTAAAPDRAADSGDDLDVAAFLGRDLPPPTLDLDPRPPEVELVGLRRLGPPPRGLERLPELLAPAVRAAGRRALEMAWAAPLPRTSPGPGPAPPDATPEPRSRQDRRPQTVVRTPPAAAPEPGELKRQVESALDRAGRPLTRRELDTAVGAPSPEVARALGELRRARLVVAVGRGPATRYALASAAPTAPGRRGRRSAPASDDVTGRLVEALRGSRSATPLRDLAERLGVAPEGLRPVLLALRQNGVVEMVGRRRSARYRLAR